MDDEQSDRDRFTMYGPMQFGSVRPERRNHVLKMLHMSCALMAISAQSAPPRRARPRRKALEAHTQARPRAVRARAGMVVVCTQSGKHGLTQGRKYRVLACKSARLKIENNHGGTLSYPRQWFKVVL